MRPPFTPEPRNPFRLVVLSAVLVAAAYLSAFASDAGQRLGAWLMAVGVAGLVTSMMALGALRPGRRSRVTTGLLIGTFLALLACFAAGLLWSSGGRTETRVALGLPLPSAIVMYGAGALLLVLVSLGYAWTFDASQLDPDRVTRHVPDPLSIPADAAGDTPKEPARPGE
jgi:O-antigen ligase